MGALGWYTWRILFTLLTWCVYPPTCLLTQFLGRIVIFFVTGLVSYVQIRIHKGIRLTVKRSIKEGASAAAASQVDPNPLVVATTRGGREVCTRRLAPRWCACASHMPRLYSVSASASLVYMLVRIPFTPTRSACGTPGRRRR